MSAHKTLKKIEKAREKIHKLFLKECDVYNDIEKFIKKHLKDLSKEEKHYLQDYIKKSTGNKREIEKIIKREYEK